KCPVKFFAHAKTIERLHAKWQERFADVKTWKLVTLKHKDAPPSACKQRGRSAASRPSTDDSDVVDVNLHCGLKLSGNSLLRQPEIQRDKMEMDLRAGDWRVLASP